MDKSSLDRYVGRFASGCAFGEIPELFQAAGLIDAMTCSPGSDGAGKQEFPVGANGAPGLPGAPSPTNGENGRPGGNGGGGSPFA